MAYTLKQLTMAWTAVHGAAPDAETLFQLQLRTNASYGDQAALSYVLNSADSSTALAALSYQFFTGKSPSKAGLEYLTNSATNPNDLNDAYYAKFGLENRYINFAANLGVQGEGKDAFAAKYGAMSFADYVASIYETIIGSSYATAAGLDPAKAIADIASRQAAILATAKSAGMITDGMTQAQIDLAVKAATAGYLMGEAIKADVGLYAAAANNFMLALATGNAVYNTDITTTYKPTPGSGSDGTGHSVTLPPPPATLPGAPPPPPPPPLPEPFHFTLTTQADTFTGDYLNDTFTGTATTLNAGDVLKGGDGNDTLTINAGFNGNYTPAQATLISIETVNITNANSGVYVDASNWMDVTKLNVTDSQSTQVTASGTQDVTITNTSQTGFTFIADGGRDVTISIADSEGTIRVGANLVPIGALVFSRTASVVNPGSLEITGGVSMDVTLTAANAVNTTQSGSATLYGTFLTDWVKVKGSAARTADANTAGHWGDTFYINDLYRADPSQAGRITSVEADGFGSLYIRDNALTTLKASNGGDIEITNDMTAVGVSATLDATLDNMTGDLRDNSTYTTLNLTVGADGVDLTLLMNGLTTLTINGTGYTALTNSYSMPLALMDASGLSGDLHWTVGNASTAMTIKTGTGVNSIDAQAMLGVLTFEGGAGDDTLYTTSEVNNVIHLGDGNNYFSGHGGATAAITAGAGNDTLWVNSSGVTVNAGNGNNQVHAGAGNMTITTGTGNDEISISGGTNTVDVGSGDDRVIITSVDANGATHFAAITGMGVGDKLDLGIINDAHALGGELTGQTSLAGYLSIAGSAAAQSNNVVQWFELGGDLYIISDASNFGGFDEGRDAVIKLVGASGLAVGIRAGHIDVDDGVITFL